MAHPSHPLNSALQLSELRQILGMAINLGTLIPGESISHK